MKSRQCIGLPRYCLRRRDNVYEQAMCMCMKSWVSDENQIMCMRSQKDCIYSQVACIISI